MNGFNGFGNPKTLLLVLCTFLTLTIIWKLMQTSSELDSIRWQVNIQDEEIAKLKEKHGTAQESSSGLWEEVIREAQGLVRHEEEVYMEHLTKEAKAYVDSEMIDEKEVKTYVLGQVKSHVVSFMGTNDTGGAKALKELASDVKKFSKDYVLSKVPPNVKEWFVFFASEARRLTQFKGDSQFLVNALKKNYWVTPPPKNIPLVLANPGKEDDSNGQVLRLMQIFNNKRNGFFIECGAFDGETSSATLYLERRMDWTGVLIEAGPDHFSKLLAKKRKSILIPACVSPRSQPLFTKYSQTVTGGKVLLANNSAPLNASINEIIVDVLCFPISTIFLAVDKAEIDIFIVSAGGLEFEILSTMPWKKVDISVLIVSLKGLVVSKDQVDKYLSTHEYSLYTEGHVDESWAKEHAMYIKNKFKNG